ncbi:unnamed protein product [Candida verbasci]|uniref:Uncharacterized protein n=1 Tax=Candida verbasci TaxID=1227364 RepID=A0A9W4U1H0_9ASCO|nr:unnamed protein product [Candida verbasci]
MIPKVRESNFGQTLGERSQVNNQYEIGPSDLIHRAIYAGSKSALYNQYDFKTKKNVIDHDEYIGYYHYINGFIDIDSYIQQVIGDDKKKFKKDIILSYCSWNIFGKTDYKIKFVLHPNGEIERMIMRETNMEELKVSQILRSLYYVDNPQHQLTGTVNFPIFRNKLELKDVLKLLVKYVSKGYETGKNQYENKLIDSILKLCKSKELSQFVYNETSFEYLRIKLLKNINPIEYLKSVQKISTPSNFSISNGLILLDQVKFLIKNNKFNLALEVSKMTVLIQPLDFETWYYLVISYILNSNFRMAISVINQIPVKLNDESSLPNDLFINTLLSRMNESEPISEKTFNDTFPSANTTMKKWHNYFIFNPYPRHPIIGYLHQSPLFNSSKEQIASVSQSLKNYPYFNEGQYGKLYNLLTFFIALYGWDQLIKLKEKELSNCEVWLDQLFFKIYQDLKICITNGKDKKRSALEWNLIGNLSYQVKFNLKESVNSLITSVLGSEFDYFGIVKLLEIYNDLILEDPGDLNYLILKLNNISNVNLNLDLDFILLHLMILISWELRWYNYVSKSLIINIIHKLIIKYDAIYLITRFKIIFENNKGKIFDKSDTIFEHIETLVNEIDEIYT